MFDEPKIASENGVSATIGVKNWLILDCISLLNIIPILGTIACLVIYAIIAFGSSSAISMKNRVIASLIWGLIWIILGLIFIFVFGGLAIFGTLAAGYGY